MLGIAWLLVTIAARLMLRGIELAFRGTVAVVGLQRAVALWGLGFVVLMLWPVLT